MAYGVFTTDELSSFGRRGRRRNAVSQGGLCATLLSVLAVAGIVTVYTHRAVGPGRDPTGAEFGATSSEAAGAEPVRLAEASVPETATPQAISAQRSGPKEPSTAYTGLLDPDYVGYRELTFARHEPVRSAYMRLSAPTAVPLDPNPIMAPLRGPVDQQVATIEAPSASAPTAVAGLPSTVSDVPVAPVQNALSDTHDAAVEVPLPAPRPALLDAPAAPSAARPTAPPVQQASAAPAPAPAEKPSFFERLFGRGATQGTALAYASPDDGGLGGLLPGRAVQRDQWTAVYNISTHTVTLPDGTQLEAHSGLGASLDDPRSVAQRMHGATPPNIYDLTLREQPFHGVHALRLTPVGSGETYGRGGLLAHTFMLGPRGDSNGCVVFRNYNAFLQAYQSGTVRRLMVVARGA
jgi:hypothetical protein